MAELQRCSRMQFCLAARMVVSLLVFICWFRVVHGSTTLPGATPATHRRLGAPSTCGWWTRCTPTAQSAKTWLCLGRGIETTSCSWMVVYVIKVVQFSQAQ